MADPREASSPHGNLRGIHLVSQEQVGMGALLNGAQAFPDSSFQVAVVGCMPPLSVASLLVHEVQQVLDGLIEVLACGAVGCQNGALGAPR